MHGASPDNYAASCRGKATRCKRKNDPGGKRIVQNSSQDHDFFGLLLRISTRNGDGSYIAEFHGNHANPDSHLFYTRVGGRKENKLTEAAINKRIEKYAFLAHEKNPDVPLDTRPDLPKIGEGFMRPQFLSERLFVQFRYTYSVLSAGSFLAVISMAIFARYRLVPTPPVAVIPVSRSTSRIIVGAGRSRPYFVGSI